MPCNSDYMNQTDKERRLQETAQLCVYVAQEWMLEDELDDHIFDQAEEYYAKDVGQVEWLCETLRANREADKEQFDSLVFDGSRKMSRRLADWWEEHLEADRQREEQEAASVRNRAVERIASKLRKLPIEKLREFEQDADFQVSIL